MFREFKKLFLYSIEKVKVWRNVINEWHVEVIDKLMGEYILDTYYFAAKWRVDMWMNEN